MTRPSRLAPLAAATALLLLVGGCADPDDPAVGQGETATSEAPDQTSDEPTDEPTGSDTVSEDDSEAEGGEVDSSLPTAHRSFSEHFTDPIYQDEADELAPFGSDEGWDLLYLWDEQRDTLTSDSTLRDILEGGELEFALDELGAPAETGPVAEPGGRIDASIIVVGAGFTLMRLTGQIDDEGRDLLLTALANLDEEYPGEPAIARQIEDVRSFDTD